MENIILKILQDFGALNPSFEKGMITGVILVFVVMFLVKIIFFTLFGRWNKCKGIDTKNNSGKIMLSIQAVKDIVKSMENEFKDIIVKKTYLYKKGNKYTIKVIADLANYNTELNSLIPDFQSKIIASMNSNLGVNNINSVDLFIRRTR